MSDSKNLITGIRGDDSWLCSLRLDLHDFLEACPQCFMQKFIAITSWDSGSFVPNETEKSVGWVERNGIAYSPKITSINMLPPHECYDEWYVFTERRDLGRLFKGNIFEEGVRKDQVAAFVNYSLGFSLATTDNNALRELFWLQYDLIQPYCFIANSDILNVVTRDKQLFKEISGSLRAMLDKP
jgi:hypothetical protein